ncbi:2-oxoglutarate and iron-dependent oxygenase domain-containing protein [Verticiella sediminum]
MNEPVYAPSLPEIRVDAKEEIPVLDLGPYLAGEPGALDRLAEELRHALENVGFYFVMNHGIDQALIDGTFAAARRFFDELPLERKMARRFNQHNVGYEPIGGSVTRHSKINENNKPNQVESYFIKRDLPAEHPDVVAGVRFRAQNQWPEDLPGFREQCVAYAAAVERLGKSLVPVYARSLGLPADYFDKAFEEPMFTLRLSHYPQRPPQQEEDVFGIAPHTDTGFMTFLPFNEVAGLSIRLPTGRWVDVPGLPGSYLINSGDMLRRWTNDRFLSTPHRVINRSGRERYAIPFFMDCDIRWRMECLPTCLEPGQTPKYPPITYTEYMSWYRAQNYAAPPTDEASPAA